MRTQGAIGGTRLRMRAISSMRLRLIQTIVATTALLLALPVAANAETLVSGVISTDTTWSVAASPYRLTADLRVDHGSRLAVEPGVTVLGQGHALEIYGILDAEGTPDATIVIRNLHLRGRGSYFVGSQPETFSIEVGGADIDGGSLQGGDLTMYGSWSLHDSLVTNVDEAMYLWYPRSDTTLRDNVFINAGKISAGVHAADVHVLDNTFFRSQFDAPAHDTILESWAAFGGHSMFANGNRFLNAGAPTVSLPDWTSSGAIDATANWWGTDDSDVIDTMVFDANDSPLSPATVAYDPPMEMPEQPADGLPLDTAVLVTKPGGTPTYGQLVPLKVTLTDLRGAPVRAAEVVLETTVDGVTWVPAQSTMTDPQGQATFSVKPTALTRYRVVSTPMDEVYGGSGSATVTVMPKAYLSKPSAPSSARRGRSFYVAGYLKPRHRAKASSVKLYFYRWEKVGGRYVWRHRKTINAANSNYSSYTKYTGRTSLPYAGRWRVRAYHSDTDHAPKYSAYDYLSVR